MLPKSVLFLQPTGERTPPGNPCRHAQSSPMSNPARGCLRLADEETCLSTAMQLARRCHCIEMLCLRSEPTSQAIRRRLRLADRRLLRQESSSLVSFLQQNAAVLQRRACEPYGATAGSAIYIIPAAFKASNSSCPTCLQSSIPNLSGSNEAEKTSEIATTHPNGVVTPRSLPTMVRI